MIPESPESPPNLNPAEDGKTNPESNPIAELEAQFKEEKNRYLYLYAEFENYKKRAQKERSDLLKFGWENVARDLILVLDNLDRALAHIPPSADKNFVDGLQMIHAQFRSTLERQGVQPITAVGQAFDHNLHEALAKEPSPALQGTISKEETKGYTLHGRLLRPARVVVSAGPG